MEVVLVFGILFSVYFFPWIVSKMRESSKSTGVFVLNLFLGWTFLGWVIALVWAVSSEIKPDAYRLTGEFPDV
jgi:hypothetical protein